MLTLCGTDFLRLHNEAAVYAKNLPRDKGGLFGGEKYERVRHIHINYGADIERSIHEIQKIIRLEKNCFLTDSVSSRFLAIKLRVPCR